MLCNCADGSTWCDGKKVVNHSTNRYLTVLSFCSNFKIVNFDKMHDMVVTCKMWFIYVQANQTYSCKEMWSSYSHIEPTHPLHPPWYRCRWGQSAVVLPAASLLMQLAVLISVQDHSQITVVR